MPASLAMSMYLSLPSFGVLPAWLAACWLQALMASRVGTAGLVASVAAGGVVGACATVEGDVAGGGVTTAVGAAAGASRASCVGAGARLATTRPVTTADATATTTPIAVSFQTFARLDSFIGGPPPSVMSTYRASD